jgi:hypothetical protein
MNVLEENKSINIAFYLFNSLTGFVKNVNCTSAVCDQKTSKFFVSHQKESMAGHVDAKGIY